MGNKITLKTPKYVSAFYDRHDILRLRFRKGGINVYMQSALGTPEFRAERKSLIAQADKGQKAKTRPSAPQGSIDALLAHYFASGDFGGNLDTKSRNRHILERFAAHNGNGKRPVRTAPYVALDRYIQNLSVKNDDGSGGHAAAEKARKQLKRLFQYAVKIGWRDNNPMAFVRPVKNTGQGYHTWSEIEIEQYRQCHKIGTPARLALELYIWTGKRRTDGMRLGRQNIEGNYLRGTDQKTGKSWRLPIAPALKTAIDAMPDNGQMTFMTNEYGRPFTPDGFGTRFRKWCDQAGLPNCTAHGLRKAIARRMAEMNENQAAMKSVTLHSDDRELAIYTANANQNRLAESAINRLVENEHLLLDQELGEQDEKTA